MPRLVCEPTPLQMLRRIFNEDRFCGLASMRQDKALKADGHSKQNDFALLQIIASAAIYPGTSGEAD
jgi:hypothetical protein